jgi:sterol 3beta-glucosyltransferase
MRIAIVANDTRGGVQPYVALALGLRAAGHDVRFVAPEQSGFEAALAAGGVSLATITGSPEEFMRQSGGAPELGSLASMRVAGREMARRMRGWTRETLAACEGMDVMTGGVGGMVLGLAVADRLGIRFVESHLQPIGPATSAFPGPLVALPGWAGGVGRRMSHRLSAAAMSLPFRGGMAQARAELGLPKSRARARAAAALPTLYGYSPLVVPVPPEWGPHRHATGYWTLPADPEWAPPPELAAFLATGPAPVCIGFGSMTSRDAVATTELVLAAVRAAGVRAVLVSGWGGLVDTGDDGVFVADSVPFDWLYPRMTAVAHHGGAGTTGAALRAGVPAVVVPFAVDQPFWASRVVALGVGPRPIPRRRLTAAALAAALRVATTDAAMRSRAADLGALIREEDGVARAVEVFGALADQLRR